jgi:hypothetical protein
MNGCPDPRPMLFSAPELIGLYRSCLLFSRVGAGSTFYKRVSQKLKAYLKENGGRPLHLLAPEAEDIPELEAAE